MAINPIAAGGVNPASFGAAPTPPTQATQATDGSGFADVVAKGVENLQGLHAEADQLAVQAATGDLTDVHDYMIASNQASLATELTVAVRNKAVEAFNEIMRMQI